MTKLSRFLVAHTCIASAPNLGGHVVIEPMAVTTYLSITAAARGAAVVSVHAAAGRVEEEQQW